MFYSFTFIIITINRSYLIERTRVWGTGSGSLIIISVIISIISSVSISISIFIITSSSYYY